MIGQTLYVRGMNMSESDDEQSWDDTKLNEAYDKAVLLANTDVAQRIAMSTNTKQSKDKQKSSKKEKKANQSKGNFEWKSGMPCRAVYEEDGLEYEAFISRIIDDKECVVRFIGYDNCEIVPLASLKMSGGTDERTRQIEEALRDNDDGFGSRDGSERGATPHTAEHVPEPRKKMGNKKKKNNNNRPMGMSFTELPNLQMPNMSMFKNLGCPDMPPPPPPISLGGRADSEESAVSTMLLSWYMTGYYTGLYQGMKRARDNNH